MKNLKREKLTYEKLHDVLKYDPETGFFTNNKDRGTVAKKGSMAGCKNTNGYLVIKINNVQYKAHRLAWLYVHGYFPEHGLDHKDQIPWHNWIDNLRETSDQCNARNCPNPKNNESGVKGVFWRERDKRWVASIKVSYKTYFMGHYKNFDNAVCARLAGEQCLDWSNCDSSSPAYQYVQKNIIRKGE